jgi:hypothetical protein
MTDQLYLGSPQNYIDAAKYFSDWATIKVLHFTQLDTKKNDMILTSNRLDRYSLTKYMTWSDDKETSDEGMTFVLCE